MKLVMVKPVRTTGKTKVIDLMAMVVDWTVRGTVVSDAERKIRVKPFYTPQN